MTKKLKFTKEGLARRDHLYEWLDKRGIKGLFIYNMGRHGMGMNGYKGFIDFCNTDASKKNTFSIAFVWGQTKQGFEYWSNVCNQYDMS